MATNSSILAWEIPRTEEPSGYHSRGHKESDTTGVTEHVHAYIYVCVYIYIYILLNIVPCAIWWEWWPLFVICFIYSSIHKLIPNS